MNGLYLFNGGEANICFFMMITSISEESKDIKGCTSKDMFETPLEILRTELGYCCSQQVSITSDLIWKCKLDLHKQFLISRQLLKRILNSLKKCRIPFLSKHNTILEFVYWADGNFANNVNAHKKSERQFLLDFSLISICPTSCRPNFHSDFNTVGNKFLLEDPNPDTNLVTHCRDILPIVWFTRCN